MSCQTNPEMSSLNDISGGQSSFTFGGITSIEQITRSSMTLHWAPIPEAVAYEVFKIINGSLEVFMTVPAGFTQVTVENLNPNTHYTFKISAKNSFGVNDSNNRVMSALTMTAAPLISFLNPITTSTFMNKPRFLISGLLAGDQVKLHDKANCQHEITSAVAASESLQLEASHLAAGTYFFSARIVTTTGQSVCSNSTPSYVHKACPIGYIPVKPNPTLGVSEEFCIMQFEARDKSSVPTSSHQGLPWVNITRTNALLRCQALGAGYSLTTNAQWMTLAADLEAQPENWTGNSVTMGYLYIGHGDSNPPNVIPIDDASDPYTNTLNSETSGTDNKRVLLLSNGEDIWDFAGNASEWINWLDSSVLTDGPITCGTGRIPFDSVSCGLIPMQYRPVNPANLSLIYYNYVYGVGSFFGGTGGGASRGGYWLQTTAGIYTVDLTATSINNSNYTGFRCVYRE